MELREILTNMTSLMAATAKKSNVIIANEVLEGKWGSGDTRKQKLTKAGYNYDAIQKEVATLLANNSSRAAVIANMEAWAVKISNDNRYSYKTWTSDVKTHQCPVCHPELMKDGEDGWNCIGFAWACWHHGGRLPCKCNCGVISNEVGERIYKAKTDAEALKIARQYVGMNEITVIRNNGKAIPKSKTKPGDIGLLFDGSVYKHTFVIMSNNKIADSTGSGAKANHIRANRTFDGRYVSGLKVIIRYTGNGTYVAPKKPYQNLKASDYIGDAVYIGQATADERGKTSGGTAGDQKGGEVSITKWSYSSSASYNHWTAVCRLKDTSKRLIVAQAMIDTCKNNHIGYDIQKPDRFTAYDEAAKVNWDISKITKNCETTCSQAVSMCLRAAGVSVKWAPRMANVAILTSKIKESGLFTIYTDSAHVAKSSALKPGDILLSATHVAVVVKVPSPKKTYSGTLPTIKLIKTNTEVINDTVTWATWIAKDNSFHYGHGQHSHHNGCYFCDTQPKIKKESGIVDWHKTYCCNPFVNAAWAHGGGVPAALKKCQNGSSLSFDKGKGYDALSIFTNLGHPAKSKLKKGDVLCKDGHVALYIGNGQIAEAAQSDDNKRNSTKWNNSIHIATLTDSRYKGFQRVHRYNGVVNTETYIRYGEVSKRVGQWQKFLDWWYNGKVGSADNIFGPNTLKWTKKFQEEVIGKGQGDGIVGPKTLEAAKKVKK